MSDQTTRTAHFLGEKQSGNCPTLRSPGPSQLQHDQPRSPGASLGIHAGGEWGQITLTMNASITDDSVLEPQAL